jgi:hypothetical protein
MALFSNQQEANLRSCVQMVEQAISSLGHDPEDSRLGTYTWRVRKGSALVTVGILIGEHGVNRLQVSADVMRIDELVDKPRLFERLLELNFMQVKGAAFALRDNTVVLVSERSTIDLDRSEVDDLVARVQEYADRYDDELVTEYGGRLAGQL